MGKRRESLALWVALSRAYGAVASVVSEYLDAHGLTLAEFGVLEALHHLGPMRLTDVAAKILVSSSGITFVADRLEERRLIRRRPDPLDRRARLLELTPEGSDFVEGIFPEHAKRIEAAVAPLGAGDRRLAIRLMRALAAGEGHQEPITGQEGHP